MRRILLLLAAVAVGVLALAPAAQGQQQGVEVNERVPYENAGPPLCGGEEIVFRGTMHVLGNITEDAAGGYHFVGHTNFQNMEAFGVQSGDRFVIRDVTNTTINTRLDDPAQLEFTTTINGRLIRLGEDGTQADDTLFHATFHVTQNANGEFTATVDNIVFHCD